MMREMMWEIKQTRCCAVRGALPPCLIQLVSKTKRTGERERSVGQKMVEKEREACEAGERGGGTAGNCGMSEKGVREMEQACKKREKGTNTSLQNSPTSIPMEEYVGFCDDLAYFFTEYLVICYAQYFYLS